MNHSETQTSCLLKCSNAIQIKIRNSPPTTTNFKARTLSITSSSTVDLANPSGSLLKSKIVRKLTLPPCWRSINLFGGQWSKKKLRNGVIKVSQQFYLAEVKTLIATQQQFTSTLGVDETDVQLTQVNLRDFSELFDFRDCINTVSINLGVGIDSQHATSPLDEKVMAQAIVADFKKHEAPAL